MSMTDALWQDPYPLNVYIADRGDNAKGSGTINDPWNGHSAEDFDDIFKNRIPALENPNVQINLGPGTFETNGYADDDDGEWLGWRVRSNWKIVGSGIDITLLALLK